MAASTKISFTTLFFFGFLLSGSYAAIFTITNKCSYTVWPAVFSAAGTWPLPTTGFALQPGDSNTMAVPPAWSGRLWARTFCSHNITGNFSCVTGDCGSSKIECGRGNPALPVTLAEFTLNNTDGLDYFDVSLMDGFNLPVRVEPRGGTGAGNCRATSCRKNLNQKCPIELKVTKDGEGVVACKSACQAEACNSTLFSQFFKSKCPEAYDHVSFTCASADYTITFCPTSSKSSMKPGNKKNKYPAAVDNSGVHVGGSAYNFRIPTATAVAFVFILCSYFACKTGIRFSNRHWEINMVAGTRAETLVPNPQPDLN